MTVKATWLGHSAVLIEGEGKRILVDPFLTGNPAASATVSDLSADLVLLTHDHEDHFGDTEAFLKKGATFVGIHELSTRFAETGYKVEGMNIGGTIETHGARITMTHALHTCYTGHVAGFVIELEGKQIYHAGDTGLSTDMRILGEFFSIDLAFLPIGDRYTMGARSASIAAGWVGAKKVVPIHFGTWPPIQGDPDAFARLCPVAVILKPGGSVTL
jgi:L-ascorbate metabolism protein UlaG (beta-lactamase superfamily)